MNIKYVIGDATQPQGEGVKIIPHCCNDKGFWNKGFVVSLSKRWSTPESSYRAIRPADKTLGNVQLVQVESDVYVVNMIAQHDVKATFVSFGNGVTTVPPIRYDALLECLKAVNDIAIQLNGSIHMPRIGCGLAGGNWCAVEKIINEALSDVDVTVYDLK